MAKKKSKGVARPRPAHLEHTLNQHSDRFADRRTRRLRSRNARERAAVQDQCA